MPITVFFIQWMLTVIQLLWFMDDVSTRWQPDPWGRATAAILGYIFFHFVYTMVFLRWNEGQTPAMDLMKLRAVRTKDGSHLGLGRCAARWLVGGAAWIVPPVVLGGLIVNAATYLTVPADRRRRTVSDWVAGTTVIDYNRDKEDPDGELEEMLDEFGQPMSVRAQIRRQVRDNRAVRWHGGLGRPTRRSASSESGTVAGFPDGLRFAYHVSQFEGSR